LKNRLIAAAAFFATMAILLLVMSGPDQNKILEKLDKYGVVTEAYRDDQIVQIHPGANPVYIFELKFKTPKGEVSKKFATSKEFYEAIEKRESKTAGIKVKYLPADPQIARLVGDSPPPVPKSKITTIGMWCLLGLLAYFGWKFRHLARSIGFNLGSNYDDEPAADDDFTPHKNYNQVSPDAGKVVKTIVPSVEIKSNGPKISVRPESIFPRLKFTGLKEGVGPITAKIGIGDSGQVISGASNPIMQAVPGGLGVMYGIDSGGHWEYLVQGQFDKMGFSHDQLHQRALANLEAWVNTSGNLRVLTLENGAFGIVAGGDFEAAFLLLDSLWDGPLKDYTPNGVVCVVPMPDICMFCDSRNVNAIRALKAAVFKFNEGGADLLSKDLYRRTAGKWQSFPIDLTPAVESIEFN
jgi:hypothetical protein